MKTHLPSLVAAATALLLSAGCASDLSGSTYSRDGARAQQAVYHGTLTRIEQVKIEGTDGAIGGIGGAVAGAAIGSTMGGGRGHTVGGALGGVGGALLGAAIEKSATGTNNGLELTVKLADGSERIVVQTAGRDSFYVGQSVRLIVSGSESRVRPE
jgi:outer membrane lipoprotein SlyB